MAQKAGVITINLSAGTAQFVLDMEKAVEMLVELVQVWEERA